MRPLSRHPVSVLRAIVAGSPPRDGEPEIRLDPQRIDQRHAFDRFARQLARQTARPARAARHHQMLDVMHRQHQRRRRIGLAEDADDARRVERAGAEAAQRRRHGQRQQSRLGQLA